MAARHGARRGFGCVVALAAALVAGLLLAGCAGRGAPSRGRPAGARPGAASSAAATGGPTAQPSWDGRTREKQFAPYDDAGVLTVPQVAGGPGRCFSTSIAVPLAGVYRCLAGNTLLDPCFAPAREGTPQTVACFLSPWSDAQVITVSGALPTFQPVLMSGNPWAIELENGVHCVVVTGAVPSYNDVDLIYHCDGSNMAGVDADSSGNLTAHYGPVDGPLIDVGVVTAWRGRSYRISG
jgi:hypothetical protein